MAAIAFSSLSSPVLEINTDRRVNEQQHLIMQTSGVRLSFSSSTASPISMARQRAAARTRRLHPEMKPSVTLLLLLLLLPLLAAQDFDFFYFVQQWPGSYCDTKQSCCYPSTGKPAADFGIHGLWPNYNDGSYPSNCDPNRPYNASEINDLMGSMRSSWPTLACPSDDGSRFWSHEWEKHGTCSASVLDQHSYFRTALDLKKRVNLLKLLQDAGVRPDGGFYDLGDISSAIGDAIGYAPGIECNADESGNRQLYQIYVCVDTSGKELIQCPVYPASKCSSRIEFPPF